ncbi:SGNH/GDSL hydrolase family protein [Pontiellaceae bacterium B1224]|nr:SGNH/GDSL hydrolase family protein [Pontiellaceae bacterium B1224]
MSFKKILGLLLCGSVCVSSLSAQDYVPEKGSTAEKKTTGNWMPNPDPDLPNVLILGDSISIGYTLDVRERLQGKANVYRPCSLNGKKAENCQGTTFGLQKIDAWLADQKWDVIHFNWGLHDLKHVDAKTKKNSNSFDDPQQADPAAYEKNLTELVAKLKATGAQLIFATTTPYPEGPQGPARDPADVSKYNDIALKIMQANDVQVNDLYTLCDGKLDEIQLPKNVHFNPAGRELQGKAVAEAIEMALVATADAEDPVRVACVGDSITFGARIEDRETNSYPAQLGQLLGEGYEVKNFGQNGATLLKKGNNPYWKKPPFKPSHAFNPDIVIIKLGTNDSKPENWKHKDGFVADYLALIESYRALPCHPVVIICRPVPVYPDSKKITDKIVREEVIPAIDEVAKQANVEIIDLYAPLSNRPDLFPDDIHPNAEGAGIMAEIICPFVLAQAESNEN